MWPPTERDSERGHHPVGRVTEIGAVESLWKECPNISRKENHPSHFDRHSDQAMDSQRTNHTCRKYDSGPQIFKISIPPPIHGLISDTMASYRKIWMKYLIIPHPVFFGLTMGELPSQQEPSFRRWSRSNRVGDFAISTPWKIRAETVEIIVGLRIKKIFETTS